MRNCIITSDNTKWILPIFKELWNKHRPGEKLTIIEHKGDIQNWCGTLYKYFSRIKDEYIFFSLDDYLPTGFNEKRFNQVLETFKGDRWQLGPVSNYVTSITTDNILYRHDQRSHYRISCQPSIWRREYLLRFLKVNNTPWEFELQGTKQSWSDGALIIHTKPPCFTSVHAGAISNRWKGFFHVGGVNPEDLERVTEFAINHGYQIKN